MGGGGGGGGGGDDRRRERERQEREARRERERFEREARRLENERKMREREAERRRQEREADGDSDKRRAEEQARAQREAEERQRQAELRAEADRQKELDEIAKRNAAENADLMPKGDPYTDPQKASGVRTDATNLRNYRERMNEALRRDSEGNIVQSRSGEVLDSKGNPVLTSQGVKSQAAFQQQELERLVSMRQGGAGDPEQGKRDLAEQIIREKLEKGGLPGAIGAIQKANLENQLRLLERGGTPTFRVGPDGRFITSGVLQPGEEGTGIAANITSDLENYGDEPQQEEQPTILQPQPDEEDVTTGTLGVAPATRGRRRTKRPGAAGTLLEGGGVLYE